MDEVFRALAELMETAGTPWALIGGHAVNAWVEPRLTRDIDVTVSADASALERLKKAFVDTGWRVVEELGGHEPSGPDFIRFTRGDQEPPVEVQVAKTAFQQRLLERATPTSGGAVPVATVEDLIVLKLIAARKKDEADLDALGRLPDVDWAYVERWAEAWEVTRRLEELRKDLTLA